MYVSTNDLRIVANSKFQNAADYVSRFLLVAFPLSILLGPRISLPFASLGDFRIQDFLALTAVIFFVALDLSQTTSNLSDLSTILFWAAMVVACLAMLYFLVLSDTTIAPFYTLRLLELPIISILIVRSLNQSAAKGLGLLLLSIVVGVIVNIGWIGIQTITNTHGPLWYLNSGDIEQYGPGLLGEPGAFPAGQTLVILLAGAISMELFPFPRSRKITIWSRILIFSLYYPIILTESRISLGFGTLLLALWFAVYLKRLSHRNLPLSISIALLVLPSLSLFAVRVQRDSSWTLVQDFENRLNLIYLPNLNNLEKGFLFGLGPGRARAEFGAEAHSLYLAVVSDFGFLGLLLFLAATLALIKIQITDLHKSRAFPARMFSMWSLLITLNFLFAGTLQSSHISATPTHLAAVILGTYFWLTLAHHSNVRLSNVGQK